MCSARRPHSVSPLLFVDNQHKVIKNEDNTIPAIITTQLYRNYTYHIYTFNMCARGTKKVQFICAVALWNYSIYMEQHGGFPIYHLFGSAQIELCVRRVLNCVCNNQKRTSMCTQKAHKEEANQKPIT